MELKKHKKADKMKWIVTTILIGVLSVGLIAVGVKVSNNEKTKTIDSSAWTYEIGAIDDNGDYLRDTSSTVMKDFVTTDGLKIDIQDDATVKYSVHFYNEDKEFIGTMENITEDFEFSALPTDSEFVNAEFVKVEVTPTNDAEVSFFEINSYVGQLSITVNK